MNVSCAKTGWIVPEEPKSKGPGEGMGAPRSSLKAMYHGRTALLSASGCHGRFPSRAGHDLICDLERAGEQAETTQAGAVRARDGGPRDQGAGFGIREVESRQ